MIPTQHLQTQQSSNVELNIVGGGSSHNIVSDIVLASTSTSAAPSSASNRGNSVTPLSTRGLRRGLRSDKDGYIEMALPYQPTRRKHSNVPLAPKPTVLQIEMMQKIGVEQCEIDPADLTAEKLLRPRA
jgi:hypothetical protein